jgi:hypothetical protein
MMLARFRTLGAAVVFVAAIAVGGAAFGVAAAAVSPLRAWEAFLVNLLFWTGLAQGGVVISAAFYLCEARWGGAALYRLAESLAGFLPFGFLLFWALLAGRYWIFPWIKHPIAYKKPYLNVPFLFERDGIGLLVMWLLSWWFVAKSRSPETVQWAENYKAVDEPAPGVSSLAAPLLIVFTLIYSMLSIDLVMSLSPQWYCEMFCPYFSFGACLSSLFLMGLLAAVGWRPRRHDLAGERGGVLHDLGKLIFGGACFWTYLLFGMYIVIWYADIPKETFFVAPRVNYAPWGRLGWTAFGLIWVLPFFALLARPPKKSPIVLGSVCFLSLLGFWLERYVLVAPSLSPHHVPFGWIECLVTIGFLGLFGLTAMPGIRLITDERGGH